MVLIHRLWYHTLCIYEQSINHILKKAGLSLLSKVIHYAGHIHLMSSLTSASGVTRTTETAISCKKGLLSLNNLKAKKATHSLNSIW